MNNKLDVLPRFTIRNISPGATAEENVMMDGTFTPVDSIRAGDRGWLFATDNDWPLADVASLEGDAARLDVCGWSITSPLDVGSSLPWLSVYWNARDVAFMMDATKEWRRVEYQAEGGWDHDHCLICNIAIGRAVTHGYREASFAHSPNSVGIWLCENCFDRYIKKGDFSFLV